jgi:phage anti-repressor protein
MIQKQSKTKQQRLLALELEKEAKSWESGFCTAPTKEN